MLCHFSFCDIFFFFFGSVQCSGRIHSVVQVSCFSQCCTVFSYSFSSRAAHFFLLWCGFSLIFSKVNFLIQWIKVKFIPGIQFFVLSKFEKKVFILWRFSCTTAQLRMKNFQWMKTPHHKKKNLWSFLFGEVNFLIQCIKVKFIWGYAVFHVVQICAFCDSEFFMQWKGFHSVDEKRGRSEWKLHITRRKKL